MGDFLLIQSSPSGVVKARDLFQLGVEIGTRVKGHKPSTINESGRTSIALYPRQNGSGAHFTVDEKTGCWLVGIGNWFHGHGYQVGAEKQLLEEYLRVGAERLVGDLEGFFLIVVNDPRTDEVIVLTDFVGSCHSFMRSWEDSVALSCSSFLLGSLAECEIDPIGCQEFLYGGVIYENRSFYKNIQKLGPATVFRFTHGRLKTEQKYWRITDIDHEGCDSNGAVELLGETLTQVAKRIGDVYPHPVCDLTGGYDSRALISALLNAEVNVSTTVSGPLSSPDVTVAGGIAKMKGLSHLHLPPQGHLEFHEIKNAFIFTDGEYDLLDYARIFRVQKRLSESFDISLNGSFGEIARGYWWELLWPHVGNRQRLDAQRVARLRYGAQSFVPLVSASRGKIDFSAHLTQVIERTNFGLYSLPNTTQMDHAYIYMRMQRWQGRIASSTNKLWPCLSPFMFRSVVEIMLKVAASLRKRSLLVRKMIETLDPQLAKFPLEHGYPALPVRLDTVLRFWPLPIHFGKKVCLKIGQKLKMSSRNTYPLSGVAIIRKKLWEDEEVRDLLEHKPMKSLALCEPNLLEEFLRKSKLPVFPYHDQWARLLSLEYTLRRIDREMPVRQSY